ncbi:MAG TPA: CoA-binding protein [Betaproteobacteria bacterium]|nr:CoA-binding protein [Betaproteobacteria bacterium]
MTAKCTNPAPAECCAWLARVKTIAVVGLSPKTDRPSHAVARAMQAFGFRIIPVRPGVAEVLGEKAYGRLADVPMPIDLVDVFRAAAHLDALVDECIALGLPALWIQEGIVNESAAQRARAAGITVVMDRCLYKDYRRYCRPKVV